MPVKRRVFPSLVGSSAAALLRLLYTGYVQDPLGMATLEYAMHGDSLAHVGAVVTLQQVTCLLITLLTEGGFVRYAVDGRTVCFRTLIANHARDRDLSCRLLGERHRNRA